MGQRTFTICQNHNFEFKTFGLMNGHNTYDILRRCIGSKRFTKIIFYFSIKIFDLLYIIIAGTSEQESQLINISETLL
ncbi:MAG: hypothetical protein BWZ03_00637 [bacterium ADurb.BinA186]|nr:MAG: hypothetical protein BWZ03_00637 [bacterium ADurb.BinA186]